MKLHPMRCNNNENNNNNTTIIIIERKETADICFQDAFVSRARMFSGCSRDNSRE